MVDLGQLFGTALELANQAKNEPLYDAIVGLQSTVMGLQNDLFQLQRENQQLQTKVDELEKTADWEARAFTKNDAIFFKMDDGTEDGPNCGFCWGNDRKRIPVFSRVSGGWKCSICGGIMAARSGRSMKGE